MAVDDCNLGSLPIPTWQRGPTIITDARGRTIELRNLTLPELMRLVKTVPPTLRTNELFLAALFCVCQVCRIDDVKFKAPTSRKAVNLLFDCVGTDGIAAITALASRQLEELKVIVDAVSNPTPKFQWIKLQGIN